MICPNCGKTVSPKHRYRSGKTRCMNRRTWTKARLWQLMEHLEACRSDEWIARKMGCTPEAINLARKRHGIRPRRLQNLTARAVGRMMGVSCSKTVSHWVRAGYLKARKVHGFGGQRMYAIRREDLWDFVADERTWHLWETARISDPKLRRYAEQVRGDVRFLTPREAGRRLFVEHQAINARIHRGELPARKWGNWWIDERDIERLERERAA